MDGSLETLRSQQWTGFTSRYTSPPVQKYFFLSGFVISLDYLQSDCRINLVDRIGENYILKATLDEFDEYRMKKNMSDEMKYKEKVYYDVC